MFKVFADALPEAGLVLCQQRLDLTWRQRDHRRSLVTVERQQRQGAAIAEPLPRSVLVRHLDLHAADQHRLAEVAHARADAQHAPGRGKAAVGRHDQLRVQFAAVGQGHRAVAGAGQDATHTALVQDFQVGLALHAVPRRAPDQMVGHQPTEVAAVLFTGSEGQRERRAAVHHPRIAQRRYFSRIEPGPQAQMLQDLARGMGQRDLAAIERSLGQRRARLLFHHGHLQARAGQRTRETQPGRSGANHQHIH